MTALPRHLTPWAAELGLFPEDITAVLGPMVTRLAALIGGLPSEPSAQGEPDGYDGIGAKGPYERLLASEWALLDEAPDEFLRRATSSEHMFLQRLYQAETATRQCAVFFDAGPDQLGAPRLGQLALLIVLAQRSKKAGADFLWGIVQDKTISPVENLNKAQVSKLLDARTGLAVTATDVARWMEATPSASEHWFIGSERLADLALCHRANALIICDVMDMQEPRRISVTLRSADKTAVNAPQAILDVPRAGLAIKLLRDPFALALADRQTAPVWADTSSTILFSYDRRKLFVRGQGGTLITFHIPNSPRVRSNPAPAVFKPPHGSSIIAVGKRGGGSNTHVVLHYEDRLVVCGLTKRANQTKTVLTFTPALSSQAISEPAPSSALVPLARFNSSYCFVDSTGDLIELANGKWSIKDTSGAVASRVSKQGLAYVSAARNEPLEIKLATDTRPMEIQTLLTDLPFFPEDTRYFFGAGVSTNILAYSPSRSTYTIIRDKSKATYSVVNAMTVVGMIETPGDSPAAASKITVILIDKVRSQIFGLQGTTAETLVTSPEPIAQVAVSDVNPVIGFITQSGGVGVYSYQAKAMVLHPASASAAS